MHPASAKDTRARTHTKDNRAWSVRRVVIGKFHESEELVVIRLDEVVSTYLLT